MGLLLPENTSFKIIEPEYFMGVDVVEIPTYCLMRKIDDVIEVVLSKSIHDDQKFKKEVDSLAEIFNATIYENGEFVKTNQ